MTHSMPSVLQIEPVNTCNFSCAMCLQTSWEDVARRHISLGTFSSLAEEVFPSLDRLVLYGWGEPLTHPDFLDLLRTAKRYLPAGAVVLIATNGALLSPETAQPLVSEELVDDIAVSIDCFENAGGAAVGHTTDTLSVRDNIQWLLHNRAASIKVGVQTIITRSNIAAFPGLVEQLGGFGVDYISVSHLYPYYRSMMHEAAYTLISAESLALLEELEQLEICGRLEISPDEKGGIRAGTSGPESTKAYEDILRRADARNISLNLPLYLLIRDKAPLFHEVETIFLQARETASRYDLELMLPEVYASKDSRKCPYIDRNAAVIRSDGEVAPCFSYLYPHTTYLNLHERPCAMHTFGNINLQRFTDIWLSQGYASFRQSMQNMNENIAWCGDCRFIAHNCFFAGEGRRDCLVNEPFCAECPYSLNLTRCLL